MSEFATVPGALKHLEQLGSSAAIADEFERRKIRSKPGCPESCAVADFIYKSVGVFEVSVDGDEAFGFYSSFNGAPEIPFRHELPDCAHRFVIDFDSGEYPNLVADHAVSVLVDERDAEEVEA